MRISRPALAGIAILLIVVAAVVFIDRCYARENAALIGGLAAIWFLAFLFLSNRVRIVLVVLAFAIPLLHPIPEFTPSVEAAAVSTIRRSASYAQSYKTEHQAEGYPVNVPIVPNSRVRGLYEFSYHPEKSATSGIADRFTVSAVPNSASRALRSFTITEDGHLYSTKELSRRAANRQE